MDFELLNFWVHSLGFDVRHENKSYNPRLYLSLKAFSEDPSNSYVMLLSENKNDILSFFGFDTSIEYDKLTEKNTFVYLCNSNRLKPIYIKHTSFKGPHAKNTEHAKFNKYLIDKYPRPPTNKEYYKQLSLDKQSYQNEAIEYFKKDNAYIEYKERKKLLNKVMEKHNAIKEMENMYIYSDFSQFIKLHGVLNIADMNIDKVIALWNEFKKQNWSGLRLI